MTPETEQPPGLLASIKACVATILHRKSETPKTGLSEADKHLLEGDCVKKAEPQEGLHVVPPGQQDTAHVLTPEAEEKMSE